MKRVLAIVALTVLTGCGPEKNARIRVVEEPVATGRVYFEGAYQFVEVRPTGADDSEFVARFDDAPIARDVAPGRYTVVSYTRPCSANCGQHLGDPTAHCQRRVDVGRNQTAELIVRTEVGERCSIRRR